jgi:c-di-GMP-binding flagellar brake protein YcgR
MALLQAVLQKLSFTKYRNKASASPDDLGVTQVLRHPLLEELKTRRQLLEITPAGSQRSYQSLIVAIDAERGLLWLDDLFPPQRLLEIGDQITLRHRREGELLTITTPIVAWGSDFGASGLAVLLPDEASYQPRRTQLRFQAGEHLFLTGKLCAFGHEPLYGTVEALSTDGLNLLVAGNMTHLLQRGTLLPICEVSLSPELRIRCRARVSAVRLCRSPYRGTRISLEFVELPGARQQQIEQFIQCLTGEHSGRQLNTYAA